MSFAPLSTVAHRNRVHPRVPRSYDDAIVRAPSSPRGSLVRKGVRSVQPAQKHEQLLKAPERLLAALLLQCATGGIHLSPHLIPAVKGYHMSPTGHDGRRVCLWFGELVAFMRDRTLDEGNDFGQAVTRDMGSDGTPVK